MILNMDFECEPTGAVLVHSGGVKEDDGGAWVPVVYQIGADGFQSGVAPNLKGGKTVVHKAKFASLSEAKYIADEFARLASA
jgi:hypothetical protein